MTQAGAAEQTSPQEAANPEAPVEAAALAPQSEQRKESRPVLNLQQRSNSTLPAGYRGRPVDPSPVSVSRTVSMAGNRPVMSDPNLRRQAIDLKNAPSIFNRPIAPNQTEDNTTLMGYLD